MKPAAVLDIGSSKVVCLCGSMADGDGIVVHGAGVCTYEGYRDGAFIDKQSLHNAVVEALQKAEQESRIRIRDVALTVPAAFSDLLLTDATLSLGKPRKTEAADIDRLIALSLEKCKKKPGYTLMHSTPVFFLVDGVSSTEVPEGITTDEISALISHMFVQEAYIRTLLNGHSPKETPPLEYHRLIRELNAIGNNLHQIAARANATGFFLKEDYALNYRRLMENVLEIQAAVTCTGVTGVEMEALTAVSVAALTVYDMCKAVQKDMEITNIRLLEKSGGKSGDYKRED